MTILSLFCASLLAGCGIRGSLKTPPPLFGGEKAETVSDAEDESAETSEDDIDLLDPDLDDR